MSKLEHANAILHAFDPHVTISISARGKYVFSWTLNGKHFQREWQTRGDSDYPVWYNVRPSGGTSCVAYSQLVRWLKGTRDLNVPWWTYICGEDVGFPKKTLDAVIEAIRECE